MTEILCLMLVVFSLPRCADRTVSRWTGSELNTALAECRVRRADVPANLDRLCNCEVNTIAAVADFPERETVLGTLQILRCQVENLQADPNLSPPPALTRVEEAGQPELRLPRNPPPEVDRTPFE